MTSTIEMTAYMDRALDRFMAKIDFGPDCWRWTGRIDDNGYGRFSFGLQNRLAYDIGWTLLVDPVPDGMTLDHVCHSRDSSCRGGKSCLHRRCVNLDHLEVVTPDENTRRIWLYSEQDIYVAELATPTSCIHGHPYTAENTYENSGQRFCKECGRIRAREYQRTRRAAARGVNA